MLFYKKQSLLIPLQLADESGQQPVRISDADPSTSVPLDESYPFNPDLQLYLSGRQLLLGEIPFPLAEIHEHYLHGMIRYEAGIVFDGKQYICARCNNNEPAFFASFRCARCDNECVYCRRCIMMGRVSQCTPLVRWTGPEPGFSFPRVLHWNGTLSPAQKEASGKIAEAIRKSHDLLVWAVCGAGKTEMLFEGIGEAMRLGKRTAIATPRTDVVLELSPRLHKVFPDLDISSLYGGSEDRHKYSPLVIATTHQLLRFREAFDCLIIDEVDAFPYSADEMLQEAAEKARTKQSSIIFLTATPEETWQAECFNGKRNCVIIPARFHRHPLPVPEFSWCGNWRKAVNRGRIPLVLEQWTEKRIAMKKQALIFFPDIELMEKALSLFRKLHRDIEAVHSEDPERKEKVERMRNGKIPVLLTTTILERGVTFPNIDVAVIGAENDIYTESALVQIAGRVGRNPKYPVGNVTFFHFGKTRAMIRAKKQLIRMNRLARQKDMIDG